MPSAPIPNNRCPLAFVAPASPLACRRLTRAAARLLMAAGVAVTILATAPGSLRAQVEEGGNPTGASGDFNGRIGTAGSYDPATGNTRRQVTDLAVQGANGAFPLAFTRTFNSRYVGIPNDELSFGNAVNWRHSYQWAIAPGSTPAGNGQPALPNYTVAYPDGAVVTFRTGRESAPAGEVCWRGPVGTRDRLEVNGTRCYLHLEDGSVVCFDNAAYPNRAARLIDPNRAVTLLGYVSGQRLSRVTEPGGRILIIEYGTVNTLNGPRSVISSVRDGASPSRTVTYNYDDANPSAAINGTAAYLGLRSVVYNYEPTAGGSGVVYSYYRFGLDPTNGVSPVLATCQDPHYAGAMVNIRYVYTAGNNVYGQIQEEQNYQPSQPDAAGERVSRRDRDEASRISTETRSDGPARTLRYGEDSTAAGTTYAKDGMLTTSTDYQGHPTYTTYRGLNDVYGGRGDVRSVTDALGHTVIYDTDIYTGNVTKVTRPGGYVRTVEYTQLDAGLIGSDQMAGRYYLKKTTDERGRQTVYSRHTNTGFVYHIDYPDGSTQDFNYQGFGVNGYAFYKVQCITDQRGAQTLYGYDETDENHGGSGNGHLGLLTSVTRSYNDGYGTVRQERTRLFYDGLDRLIRVTDPGRVTERFSYNARGQLTQVLHGADGTHVDSTYDDFGNGVSVRDELGHVTTTTYDEYRRVLFTRVPVNTAAGTFRFRQFVYDHRDNDNNPTATARSHTAATWGVSWVYSLKAVQRVYSANGWVSDEYAGRWVEGANGTVLPHPGAGAVRQRYNYNALGQLQKTTDAQGQIWTNDYDHLGRLAYARDPLSTTTGSTVDNHTTSYHYFGAGENDEAGAPSAGWLKSVVGPTPDLVFPPVTHKNTSHDAMGRVLETKDPRAA